MVFRPTARKLVLSAHLTFSIGWIGAAFVYLGFGITAETSDSDDVIRAAWTAMEISGWYVIVPLALGSLASGVVIALGTKWGLLRHYWVVISLLLTLLCAAVLVLHMRDVSVLAQRAQKLGDAELRALGGDLGHPAIGIVLLLVVQLLNIYKAPGLTRYGWRKQQEQQLGREARLASAKT